VTAFDLHAKIRAVVALKDGEYDSEGDAWISVGSSPDDVWLRVDALADAVYSALIAEAKP
jgi:hypothetical protein